MPISLTVNDTSSLFFPVSSRGPFQKQFLISVSHCSNHLRFCYASLSTQFSQGIQSMGDQQSGESTYWTRHSVIDALL